MWKLTVSSSRLDSLKIKKKKKKKLFLIAIVQRNESLDDRYWTLTGISSCIEAGDSLKEIAHLSQQPASLSVFAFSANFISLLCFPGIWARTLT